MAQPPPHGSATSDPPVILAVTAGEDNTTTPSCLAVRWTAPGQRSDRAGGDARGNHHTEGAHRANPVPNDQHRPGSCPTVLDASDDTADRDHPAARRARRRVRRDLLPSVAREPQ